MTTIKTSVGRRMVGAWQVMVAVLVVAGLAPSARSDVQLANLFGDHMVLQRGMPVAVWGQATPGEKVTVSFAGASVATTADGKGQWKVKLPAMKENAEGRELIVAGRTTNTIKNVLVGDVWLCSGQSNMAFPLGGCNSLEDIKTADFSGIRFITLPVICGARPNERVETKEPWFRWNMCKPGSVGGVSGVGFYFARRVYRETGIPIGLLVSSVGGTNIEKWMPREAFAGSVTLDGMAKVIVRAEADYRNDVSNSLAEVENWVLASRQALRTGADLPDTPPVPVPPALPLGKAGDKLHLYNGMIHPLINFAIKGVLWYQGENNGNEGDSYFEKMNALIGAWRKRWGEGDFPFYLVQLANYQQSNDNPAGGDGWAGLRMAQLKCLQIPRTGLAVAIDLADPNDPNDIHPKNKCDVGERLALWALKNEYGKDVVVSGPLYKGMKSEGAAIRVSFDHVGGGLMVGRKEGRQPAVEVKDAALQRFAVAGEDRKWVWADAVIDGATVVVSSPQVPHPVALRYAYSMNPAGCNLYNREGLPASPFSTDDWQGKDGRK